MEMQNCEPMKPPDLKTFVTKINFCKGQYYEN